MIVTETDPVMLKVEAVMAAMRFVYACTHAQMTFAPEEIKNVVVRWMLIAPALRDEALNDLTSAMSTPGEGVLATRIVLSLMTAYGLGAGLQVPSVNHATSA